MPDKTNETTTDKQTNGSTNLSEKRPPLHSSQPNEINAKSDLKFENGKANGKDIEEDEPPTADVVVPLDGGWGWMVVLASFLCCTVVDGIVMNAGVFFSDLITEFNISAATVAWVGSLLSGFYLIAGPFVSAMANRWGFRVVTIVGSIIASASFAIASQSPNLYFLFLFYGIIGGIGFSMIYIPAVIVVGLYFERWRALATGIAMCGSGVGTFVMAPLCEYLCATYGWRTSYLVLSAVILTCILCGLVFRPLESVQVTAEPEQLELEAKIKNNLPAVFTKPSAEGRYAFSVPNSSHNTWIGAQSNTRYPTAAEVFRGSNANLDRRTSITPSATPNITSESKTVTAISQLNHTTKKLEQLSKAQQKRSGTATPTDETPVPVPVFNVHKELNTVGEDDENETEALLDQDGKAQITGRRHTVSGRRPTIQTNGTPKKPADGRKQHFGSSNRPLYRDDIFFSGSLARIPQYQSQTSLGYHMSVTRIPTKQDVEEEKEAKCRVCPEAVRRTLATMLDLSLLKSPSLILLALSGFFTMMGFFVPFLYISQRAVKAGMDKGSATAIVSAIGVANTIARIVCGFLSSFESVDAMLLSNVAITLGGVATIISGFTITPASQYTYAVVFGLGAACFSALRSIIVVDLMGIEKLTNAFGILMLMQGLAATLGGPIAGALYDATKNYDYSFYFAGGLITLSAFLCYPLKTINRWEKQRALEMSKVSPKV